MKQQIWKFKLDLNNTTNDIRMPVGARVLTVQVQPVVFGGFEVNIWCIVNPENDVEVRKFEIVGTGQELNHTPRNYVGTVQLNGGKLVLHVFEKWPPL